MDKKLAIRAASVIVIIVLVLNTVLLALGKIELLIFWLNILLGFIAMKVIQRVNRNGKTDDKGHPGRKQAKGKADSKGSRSAK